MKSEREERRNEEKNAKRGSRSVSDRGICSLESTCSSASHICEIDRFLSASILYLGHVSSNKISNLFPETSLISFPRDRFLPLGFIFTTPGLPTTSLYPRRLGSSLRIDVSPRLRSVAFACRPNATGIVFVLVSSRPPPFCLHPPPPGTILIGSLRSLRATHTHPQT